MAISLFVAGLEDCARWSDVQDYRHWEDNSSSIIKLKSIDAKPRRREISNENKISSCVISIWAYRYTELLGFSYRRRGTFSEEK